MEGGEIDAVEASESDFQKLQRLKRRAKRAERVAKKKKRATPKPDEDQSESGEYRPVNLQDVLQKQEGNPTTVHTATRIEIGGEVN